MEMSPFLFGLYKFVKLTLYPFMWIFLLVTAGMVLALLPLSASRLRWIRRLLLVAFLVMFILGNPVVARTLVGFIEQRAPAFDTSIPKRFDAIVILGGGAVGKGTLRPSDQLMSLGMERTICGTELYTQGFAPRLLVAGGDGTIFGPGPIEAFEMQKLAKRLGVPEGAIVLDTESRSTYENAVQAKRILGPVSVLLVTSASHVPRAAALFRKQGFHVTAYPCGFLVKDQPGGRWDGNPFDLIPSAEALHRSAIAISEIAGIVVYSAIGKI
jgi:uncharacterized SAM-binding protein YcdF (DUF218 family)